MKKIFKGLAVAIMAVYLSAGAASATSYTFNGNIAYHNDVINIAFNLASDATDVEVWTDSFLGGVGGDPYNGVNFDPITAVWKQSGSDFNLVGQNDDNGSIAAGQTVYDSGLVFPTLSAGNYLFTIAAYNNFANSYVLSGGFNFDNQTQIALSQWSQPANHSGMGTFYEVHLTGVDGAINDPDHGSNPVPEPSTMLLLGGGLAGLAFWRKRKNA